MAGQDEAEIRAAPSAAADATGVQSDVESFARAQSAETEGELAKAESAARLMHDVADAEADRLTATLRRVAEDPYSAYKRARGQVKRFRQDVTRAHARLRPQHVDEWPLDDRLVALQSRLSKALRVADEIHANAVRDRQSHGRQSTREAKRVAVAERSARVARDLSSAARREHLRATAGPANGDTPPAPLAVRESDRRYAPSGIITPKYRSDVS